MDAPDPRTRNKVSFNAPALTSKSTVLTQLVLSDLLLVLALHAGKTCLLSSDIGVFWVLVRVLACGGVGVTAWAVGTGQVRKKKTIEWSVAGTASLLFFLRQAAAAIVLALLISFISDAGFFLQNLRSVSPAYGALALEALSSSLLDHTQGVLLPSLGQPMVTAISTLGAFLFSLPLYLLRHVLADVTPPPFVSLKALSIVPFLAFVVLYYAPKISRTAVDPLDPSRYIMASYPLALLHLCVNQKMSDPVKGSPYASTSKMIRAYLKSILSNPESRKIFYFLMLNMCYMLVQMLYGVWTNSLGLISDAIHMAFDCMAIGVGLIASVMARRPPNEKFTYGYGRIETLSGFANGIFLILISLFIVFEAIQRLLDPPEMNTSQLLLVSTLGLGVNLFGMFAMGGHHHGGHSHSHGHSHGHSAAEIPSISSLGSLLQEHVHDGHSHTHEDDAHTHIDQHTHVEPHSPHEHEHTHSQVHPIASTSHSPHSPDSHPHSHSHDSHSHSHSPDPHTPDSPPHSHSHDSHSHSHTHAEGLSTHTNSAHDHEPASTQRSRQRGSLQLPFPHRDLDEPSPLTPSYEFGFDKHFDTHHSSVHTPNLHDHSHVHAHPQEGHSHNMRGVFLHVMADTLGSVGVILSTLLIQLYGWTGFDPIASLFIAVLIAASVFPLVIDTGKLLALDLGERETSIQQSLTEVRPPDHRGARVVYCTAFWPKDAASVIGSIHIQLAPSPSSHDPALLHSQRRPTYANVDRVVERVDKLLRSRIPGLEELTIQVEELAMSD
ncbi:cation efflux protein [Amylocystis lapponica]|nr:cation efflux protein [Amylocystis lapponica]